MKLELLTRNAFGNRRWKRPTSLKFASAEMLVPLGMTELAQAVMCFPIPLVRQGAVLRPMALLGVRQQENLFVSSQGRWDASHLPSHFSCHPFYLATLENGERALAVDMDNDLVGEAEGEAFFEGDAPSPLVGEILTRLKDNDAGQQRAIKACAALETLGVVIPWPVSVQGPEGTQTLEGLLRIDESALNRLPIEALDQLRHAGALALAYCQMLSLQHLPALGKLARNKHAQTPAARLARIDEGGTISFSNL